MDAQLRLIPRGTAPASEPEAARPSRPRRGDLTSTTGARRREAARPARRDAEPTEAPLGWRIDDTARERGRVGITRAREALRQARRPLPHDHHTTAA
jgi:hypothetical protein